MLSKSAKRNIIFCIIFSLSAILFTLLYIFDVINGMGLLLTVVYVSYFAGIALYYNGGYSREKDHLGSSASNFLLGTIFIVFSIVMLIVGLVNGDIVLW